MELIYELVNQDNHGEKEDKYQDEHDQGWAVKSFQERQPDMITLKHIHFRKTDAENELKAVYNQGNKFLHN